MDAELESALSEYFAECEEILGRVADLLRAIEHDQFTSEHLDAIYRDIHTVKGTSQLFGFQTVGELAHAMEASLDPVRRLQIKPSSNQMQALYVALDLVEEMIASLKASDARDFHQALQSAIPRLLDSTLELLGPVVRVLKETQIPVASLGAVASQNETSAGESASAFIPPSSDRAATAVNSPAASTAPLMQVMPVVPVMAVETTVIPATPVSTAPVAPKGMSVPVMAENFEPSPIESKVVVSAKVEPVETKTVPLASSTKTSPPSLNTSGAVPSAAPRASDKMIDTKSAGPASPVSSNSQDASDSSSTIRVPVSLLDKLMTLMGEMVLVRNQVLQYANKSDHLEFLNLSQRLDVVTSEIQGEVMKTRMQPIGNVLSKFHRVVRDLSRDLGKKIELELSGNETEVDKTLLEAVKDPIMHIVRNSCDHGIETVEDRRAAGKPESGTVSIRSFHEGGQVVIEISDDGKGLNRDKLISKAIEKGLLSSEKAQNLTDRDAFQLIFAAGFSTAAAVTNVSGRGVGMDVVKTNIEGIGGIVEVESSLGHGMKIRLKIPLTLAIVPAMIVRSAQDLFAIPQVKLVELVRIEKGSSVNAIESLQGHPVYRLRGSLLPLVSLDEVLGVEMSGRSQLNSDITNIVVLSVENQMFGLIVDEVQDTAEVVVKPLSGFLKALTVYSGATVLGDGSVALILDVMGIAQKSHLLRHGAKDENNYSRDEAESVGSEDQEFLLIRVNSPTRHAVPLNLVHRLEEFPRRAIEYSGAQRVVRYRDLVLPIVSLNEQLQLETSAHDAKEQAGAQDTLSVIVLKKNDRLYGMEVDEILDVLKTSVNMDEGVVDRMGVFGNIVTDNEIVVIVDVMQILDGVANKLGGSVGTGAEGAGSVGHKKALVGNGRSVLFVEDTAFFRKHVRATLEKNGFRVTTAINGEEAHEILLKDSNVRFDVILSDIEMPKMNGLQFATAVRKLDKWKSIPMIALTTKFSKIAQQEGLDAGFDVYLEKLKADELMETLALLLVSGARENRSRVDVTSQAHGLKKDVA